MWCIVEQMYVLIKITTCFKSTYDDKIIKCSQTVINVHRIDFYRLCICLYKLVFFRAIEEILTIFFDISRIVFENNSQQK